MLLLIEVYDTVAINRTIIIMIVLVTINGNIISCYNYENYMVILVTINRNL